MNKSSALAFSAFIALNALAGCTTQTTDDPATESASLEVAAQMAQESDALVVEDLPNFLAVRPGVFRGGLPTSAGYARLRSLGVTTVISLQSADILEDSQADIDADQARARALGMRWEHIPMQAFTTGRTSRFNDKVNRALDLLVNHGPGGVYLHCAHGRDRTGMVMAVDRVEHQGWTPQAAYKEMIHMGFRTYFIGLKQYFERRTNYDY